MRAFSILLPLLVVACSGPDAARHKAEEVSRDQPALTAGEERTHIAPRGEKPATLRSGPKVPVSLPAGFTVYPGAKVVSSTVVERGGKRHMLAVFETADPLDKVVPFYRAEAQRAGASLSLDLGGDERASLGGTLATGGEFSIAARQRVASTRVEVSASRP